MKILSHCVLLLWAISIFGQNDSIFSHKEPKLSVVAADKMNVVYRGILNPISIAVSDCKSFKVSGLGVKEENGKYYISPGRGLESIITIDIILDDGTTLQEKHIFRIKNIPSLHGSINGLICNNSIVLMTKKELINSILSIKYESRIILDTNFDIKSFTLKFGNKNIEISGNKFTQEALDLIKSLPKNYIFEIIDFKSTFDCNNCMPQVIVPLKIMIVK